MSLTDLQVLNQSLAQAVTVEDQTQFLKQAGDTFRDGKQKTSWPRNQRLTKFWVLAEVRSRPGSADLAQQAMKLVEFGGPETLHSAALRVIANFVADNGRFLKCCLLN